MLVDQEENPNQSRSFEGEIDLNLDKEFVRLQINYWGIVGKLRDPMS